MHSCNDNQEKIIFQNHQLWFIKIVIYTRKNNFQFVKINPVFFSL